MYKFAGFNKGAWRGDVTLESRWNTMGVGCDLRFYHYGPRMYAAEINLTLGPLHVEAGIEYDNFDNNA